MKNITTKILLLTSFAVTSLLGLFIISGVAFAISKALAVISFFIWMSIGIFTARLALGFFLCGNDWVYVPFLRYRLRKCNEHWIEVVDYVKATGDCGMCCNEVMAAKCAKEHSFGSLIEYAEQYGYTVEVNGETV